MQRQHDETIRGHDSPAGNAQGTRRRCGRVRIENLPCSLGTVLDLSASGMRITTSRLSAKHTGEVVPVELNGTHHSVKFMAEVTWGERVGFRKHVVGLRFLDLTEEQRQKISAIARTYAIRMGMGA